MADLAQLKQKYQPVLDRIEKEGAQLNDLSLGRRPALVESNRGFGSE